MRGGDERIFGTLMRFSKTEENFLQKSELRFMIETAVNSYSNLLQVFQQVGLL
jgi:hypothetical protein